MKKDRNISEDQKYIDSVHRAGRIGSLIALGFMVGIPIVICTVFDCFPNIPTILQAGIGLLAMMLPLDFSEIIGYAPILGSSSYITFITGNVMNLKLPVAISAQQIAGVEANTQESDAVSSMAVALSSIETILIIAACVILLKPLEPVFNLPVVKTATQYMIPALFGSLALGIFSRGGGKKYIKNKSLIALAPLAGVVLGLIFIPGMEANQGLAMLAAIPVSIGWAYFLYKKGIVKMVDCEENPDLMNQTAG